MRSGKEDQSPSGNKRMKPLQRSRSMRERVRDPDFRAPRGENRSVMQIKEEIEALRLQLGDEL